MIEKEIEKIIRKNREGIDRVYAVGIIATAIGKWIRDNINEIAEIDEGKMNKLLRTTSLGKSKDYRSPEYYDVYLKDYNIKDFQIDDLAGSLSKSNIVRVKD